MARLRTPKDQTLAASTAREVRAEMGRQGVSQADLAKRLSCTQRTLSRRLTGDVAIETDLLENIATALGVPVTQFLPAPVRAA